MASTSNSLVKRARRHAWPSMALSLAALAMPSALFAQEAPPTAAHEAPQLAAVAVGIHGGYGFYQSAHGGWTDVFIAREFEIAGPWSVQGELGALLVWSSQADTGAFHNSSVEEDNKDRNLGYGVLGRALLTWRPSRPFVLRAGVVLGYALMNFESSICGTDSTGGPSYGLSLGPAFRLGRSQRIEIGAAVEMLTLPFLRCGNAGINPSTGEPPWPIVVEPEEFFDDPGIVVAGRITHRWF